MVPSSTPISLHLYHYSRQFRHTHRHHPPPASMYHTNFYLPFCVTFPPSKFVGFFGSQVSGTAVDDLDDFLVIYEESNHRLLVFSPDCLTTPEYSTGVHDILYQNHATSTHSTNASRHLGKHMPENTTR